MAQASESALEDNLMELASELSHSNFNVKQFKRMHAAKATRLANQRTLSRIHTEHADKPEPATASLLSRTVAQGLNKTLRYNEAFIPPKKQPKFFSKPLVKSAERFQEVRSRKKLASEKTMASGKQGEGSDLQRYEREWSRGKMKERCMEEWLNAILVEYCHDEYFDKGIANSALKKLGVDENSLIAKGLAAESVGRLYRGLFVFGMGFNSLVGELAGGNMEVLKTVWRIYSVVLEYCSRGGMVTVVGEIERDASAKVAVLTGEIARRQEIIERNEELNEVKNAEIFREIKKLREDNVNLNNEKTVLVEEYNSTEQAFSEEVALRLKFETKINEIYGLHRELAIKHQRLFSDYSVKAEELRATADRYFEATVKSQEFRETQYKLREELVLLRLSSKKQGEYVEELVRERIELLNRAGRLDYRVAELQAEVAELKHKEERWVHDRVNMEAAIEFRQKSSKETHAEYQITLEENNRLYILLSDQRKVMEEYERDKKNFNSKVIAIVSENSFHKRKLEELTRRHDALQDAHRQALADADRLALELDIKAKSEQTYQTYFSSSEQNLVEMRRINIAHEEELAFLRKYHTNMERVLKEKNERLEALSGKHQSMLSEAERLAVELQELQSKCDLLAEQKQMAEEGYLIKEARLKVMEEELELRREQLEKARVSFAVEEERLRTQLEQVMVSFKNERFERTTLNNSYMQTLKIVEKKNAAERELNVKVSLLEGDVEKERTRYRALQKNMNDTIDKMAREQQKLEATLELQRTLITSRQEHQHRMVAEDLQAALLREAERNAARTAEIKTLRVELEKARKLMEQEVERLKQNHRWDTNVLTKQADQRIEGLTNDLAFHKKGIAELKEQIKELEATAEAYRTKASQRDSAEREEVYRKALEEKRREAETMLAEMERLQDQLQETKRANATLAMQLQASPTPRGDDSERSLAESLRKQLEHEFSLKFRELQRQMRAQGARRQAELREEQEAAIRGMSVEEILRVKEMKASELIKELSLTHKTDRFRELSAQHSVEVDREGLLRKEAARAQEDTRNRRQINRLIRNAYDYYN